MAGQDKIKERAKKAKLLGAGLARQAGEAAMQRNAKIKAMEKELFGNK